MRRPQLPDSLINFAAVILNKIKNLGCKIFQIFFFFQCYFIERKYCALFHDIMLFRILLDVIVLFLLILLLLLAVLAVR